MNDYQLMRNKLIPTASRCATRSTYWAETGVLPSKDGAKWSNLFHAAMDLMAYEGLDARPAWIIRAIQEGATLSKLWKQEEMNLPGKRKCPRCGRGF
jgi:hypothetical protein